MQCFLDTRALKQASYQSKTLTLGLQATCSALSVFCEGLTALTCSLIVAGLAVITETPVPGLGPVAVLAGHAEDPRTH